MAPYIIILNVVAGSIQTANIYKQNLDIKSKTKLSVEYATTRVSLLY